MTEQPFKSVSYYWLADGSEKVSDVENKEFGQVGWIAYPMPPELGHGGYELLELSLGMSLVRSTVSFNNSVAGQYIPVLNIHVEFHEPTFQAMVTRGLRGIVEEQYPSSSLELFPGNDLFRHTPRYNSLLISNTSFSGETCHVSAALSTLERLIGNEEVETILLSLGLAKPPAIAVHPIPLHVSNLLIAAGGGAFSGNTRRLFSQAKILEYLAALIHLFSGQGRALPVRRPRSIERAQAIREQLICSAGKLPSLDELARQYGRSAKVLNDEFAQEFGKSIFAFASDHRLAEAHAALLNTDVSIKQLAARLGYTHVSNFTIAFKRRFGYPPGCLRRKKPITDQRP